ncbi:unnamed protein product [Oreochromis niloticus]|nr:unnamed protein product [Mustela putorius furo]
MELIGVLGCIFMSWGLYTIDLSEAAELKAVLVSGLVEKGIVAFPVSASPLEHGVVTQPVPQVPAQAVGPSVSTPVAQGLPEDPPMTLPRFEPLSVESSVGSKQDAKLRVRLARLQLEKEEREREFQLRKELELRRLDAELARAREVELKKVEVEAETAVKLRQLELQQPSLLPTASIRQADTPFDVGKNSRLVPVFRDTEVDSYFESFERIATALRWPRDSWAILLQCKLAEAYRQRFRGLKRGQGQSYLDFAREKGVLFDRWCAACKATDLASIRELILIEEFKNCIAERIAVYINEQKVSSLQQAATLADEFVLVHKTSVSKYDRRDAPVKASEVPDAQHPKSEVFVSRPKADRKCFFCFKSGHLIADCEAYKRKQSVSTSRKPKGVGLIKTMPPVSRPPSPETPDECFKPFIFKGTVSLSGKPEDKREVTILRDTGGSQSLMLVSVLEFDEKSDCDASVIVRGVGMSFVPAPLHRIWVQSELASGFFSVGVRPSFPINGVDFIMGNDIAGGRVYPTPEVTNNPVIEPLFDALSQQHPDVFPVSVLTRSRAQQQGGGVDLSESVIGSILEKDVMPCTDEGDNGALESAQSVIEPAPESGAPFLLTREALVKAQKEDPSLVKCFTTAAQDKGGPYVIVKKVSDTNYILDTPERRRKTRLCHVNMLKPYHTRDTSMTESSDTAGMAVPGSVPVTLLSVEVKGDDDLGTLSEGQQYYWKVNAVTVSDSFPLPCMEDCIDIIGPAKFITKLDLLKGYWQVPLTSRASDISAFVTPDHFMQYTVMAFGMKNAPATFQRLMQLVLGDVPQCNVYLDDVVLYTDTWADHMSLLRAVFQRLAEASLTLNLAKCEFGKATVTYLGKQVGFGQVRPVEAKITAILDYPSPTTRRELRRFLGMTGYYRCFCKNFSVVVTPLTKLCSPKVPFEWSAQCQHAFESAKSLLCSTPVVAAPNFSRPFKLEVDASATGAGAVLLQDDEEGVWHPVCYFSAKFKHHQLNYSTIEKEALALLLALQHFTVYVGSSASPVTVFTDHNPLVFLNRMYNHNQRLMRWALWPRIIIW